MPPRKSKASDHPTTAVQDVPDLRDWPFEASLKQLRRYVTPPRSPQILDQQQEGACTGFGLAAIINLLNKQRGSKVRVSPRMLYEMAKLHDEWPGEGYAGSSCRGAIKGWFNMGGLSRRQLALCAEQARLIDGGAGERCTGDYRWCLLPGSTAYLGFSCGDQRSRCNLLFCHNP